MLLVVKVVDGQHLQMAILWTITTSCFTATIGTVIYLILGIAGTNAAFARRKLGKNVTL